jgi:hypothetical protein
LLQGDQPTITAGKMLPYQIWWGKGIEAIEILTFFDLFTKILEVRQVIEPFSLFPAFIGHEGKQSHFIQPP